MGIEKNSQDGTRESIDEKRQLKNKISNQYQKTIRQSPILVRVLKGSFIFSEPYENGPDLQAEVDFMEVSSYGSKQESSRQPRIGKDLSTNIDGRHVIVVEDIVDTGYSFDSILKILKARNPASLKTCALVSKPDRREVEVPIDYLGFTIGDVWVEGYGMDTNQKNRGLPDVVFRKT
jgi:hypoxanthine phosphoribosyltransferase